MVISLLSRGISSVLGVALGLLSSSTLGHPVGVRWPAVVLRRGLASCALCMN